MTTLDRNKSIKRLSVGEVTEEIKEEVLWCWKLWCYICAFFQFGFCLPKPRQE